MTNERSTFKRYKIISIRLDSAHDKLYDLMTFQLPSLLDTSSNKGLALKIIALIEKNFSNPMKN